MNKNQILLEINAAIAAMLDSNWSYFSAPLYMKGFFADGIIRWLLYDDFLWPHIPPISFPEAAILLVSDGDRFFQRMTKGTPGDEVDIPHACL